MNRAAAATEVETLAAHRLVKRRRQLWGLLALLAVLSTGLAGWYVFQKYVEVENEALARVSLYARVLEEQATRTITSAANMLRSLSARGTVRRAETAPSAAYRLLKEQLSGQPYLRSVAILDEGGHVLMSTNDADIGRQIDLRVLDRAAADASGQAFGPLLPIRQLADLDSAAAGAAATALPLLRHVPMSDDMASHWLVTLINLDYIATQQTLITSGSNVQVVVSDLSGQVISAAGDITPSALSIEALPPFTRFLPQREHGSYVGAGSSGENAVVAFRVSRQWPLVILAEEPQRAVMAAWRGRAGATAAIAIGVIALLSALGWAIDRSLRREHATMEHSQRLDRELAETEQRWKLALDSAGHVVWDLDVRSGKITVSPRIRELLGYESNDERWTVAGLRELTHPTDVERTTRTMESHLRGELTHYEDEVRLRTRSGHWKWVLSRAKLVGARHGDGQRPHLIGTITDIDTRKAAESALRESETRQQAILNSALDGIVVIDQAGRVLQFNPAAEAMFGRRQADVVRQPMHELIVPPHLRQAHQDGMARYLATGHGPVLNARIEIEAMRADGTLFPIELSIVPVKSEASEIYTATVRDITERLRVQAALHDSEARARATFEQAAVGVVEMSFERRLTNVNQTLCQILGYTRDELLMLNPDEILHPEELAVRTDHIRAVASGESSHFAFERRYRHKDGSFVWLRVTGSPMRDEQGQAASVVCIVENISDRRRAEEELEHAHQRELNVGARIQQSLLVTTPPTNLGGLQISSFSQASQGIDGDFVEVIRVGTHCVDIIAGDVMGKGLAAAMMGAATKLQFSRSISELLIAGGAAGAVPSPDAVVAAVHRAMTPALQALEAFVTLSYLRLDTRRRTVTWVGCGHEETLHVGRDGATSSLFNQHPPLGVLDRDDYGQDEMALAPGDTLFLYSDGVTDAVLSDGSRVGRQRAEAAATCRARRHDTPAAVLHALRNDLLPPGVTLPDDLTLVVVQWPGEAQRLRRIELPAQLSSIRPLREFVEAQTRGLGLDETTCGLLVVACVEAFTNVIRHAQGLLAGAPVEVVARRGEGALALELVYLGEPFTPQTEPLEPELGLYPEGGFGLQIMHGACDEVEHLSDAGVNTIRLLKRLG